MTNMRYAYIGPHDGLTQNVIFSLEGFRQGWKRDQKRKWWTLQHNAAVLSIQCPRNINSNTISYLLLILAGIHRLQLKFPIPKIDSDPGHTSLQRVALWPGFCPICNSIPSIVFDLLITITLWIYPSSIAIPRPNISQLWVGKGVVFLPCCYSWLNLTWTLT